EPQGLVAVCQLLTPASTGSTGLWEGRAVGYCGLGRPSFMGTRRFLWMMVVLRGSCMKVFGRKGGSRTVREASMLSGCLRRVPTMLGTVMGGFLTLSGVG